MAINLTRRYDLGGQHWLQFISWQPDFEIAANAAKWAHLSVLLRATPAWGANIEHLLPDGQVCGGVIEFDTELHRAYLVTASEDEKKRAVWRVESWEPLTLSPSLRCHCGDHGFIRNGKWVKS